MNTSAVAVVGWSARASVVALSLAVCAACGKSTPAPQTPAGKGAAAAVGLPAGATATAADPAAQDKLARAMAAVRCQLLGGAVADPKVYATHGFASAAAYATAWDAAATADPRWAADALARAQATPCPGSAAAGPARAATPTEVPAGSTAEGL
jgi:hypothetical protein